MLPRRTLLYLRQWQWPAVQRAAPTASPADRQWLGHILLADQCNAHQTPGCTLEDTPDAACFRQSVRQPAYGWPGRWQWYQQCAVLARRTAPTIRQSDQRANWRYRQT